LPAITYKSPQLKARQYGTGEALSRQTAFGLINTGMLNLSSHASVVMIVMTLPAPPRQILRSV
jgi:hypothetical protein